MARKTLQYMLQGFLFGHNSYGEPADANQLARFIDDADIPDVGFCADMDGPAGAGYPAASHWAEVIGIYFETDANILFAIYQHIAGHAAQAFCEHYRSATMEDAEGLIRAFVHRHAGTQRFIVPGAKLYSDQLGNVGRHLIEPRQIYRLFPNHRTRIFQIDRVDNCGRENLLNPENLNSV